MVDAAISRSAGTTTNSQCQQPSQFVHRTINTASRTIFSNSKPGPWARFDTQPEKTRIWKKNDKYEIAWKAFFITGQELTLWNAKIQSWIKGELIDWETGVSTYTQKSLEAFFENGPTD